MKRNATSKKGGGREAASVPPNTDAVRAAAGAQDAQGLASSLWNEMLEVERVTMHIRETQGLIFALAENVQGVEQENMQSSLWLVSHFLSDLADKSHATLESMYKKMCAAKGGAAQ